ncbi:hypothetical protein H2248_000688 [Termitomyces sp. 'cryptogamus']|nr:hypothetical protein H2248_000688 [Termitomyces sp. 'cryptogamus']
MSSSSLCLVLWPSAPLTDRLVRNALDVLDVPIDIVSSVPQSLSDSYLIQWASYDLIDHELTHQNRQKVLSSSYIFRKALIRKHFLSRCLTSYTTKHPSSPLKVAIPKTYEIEISFADELDEMWADDLWELGVSLEKSSSWWILKPGMSDRGMGIRLFNTKESLQQIFEEFELSDDEDESSADGTAVVTSQLRHFVVQEYLPNPLLLDPFEAPVGDFPNSPEVKGYKFHLRAYCVASGALQVYLYDRILALFSSVPYVEPHDTTTLDLRPHLTNTSLQTHKGEEGVRLFDELIGCRIFSLHEEDLSFKFTRDNMAEIVRQMVEVLGETFKAALENPVHFQVISSNILFLILVPYFYSPCPTHSSCTGLTSLSFILLRRISLSCR